MTTLTQAFRELCGVTRARPDQSEAGIAAMAERLFKVLGEYPEPVALTALDIWPRRSEWFPTEKELRDLLEEIAANAAREAAARGKVGGGRYNSPVGNTVRFVERVREIRGADYVKSWLAGGVTAQFSANHVYTTGIGYDRLTKDCHGIAEACGVLIYRDPDVSKMLADYCDRNGLKFDEPKRRRK